ncbi:MAG TPA: cytochrome c-type biogenesis protein [Burkholderiales bacterium]|nr:cytochrome c-type biogenesis protein [Burkholderiales bacterium]
MKILIFFLALMALGPTFADSTPDPEVEARIARIAAELRCLVCQNQSIADSNADLAVDLRNQIREQIRAGRSDAEITEFMVQRYGDFVLYRPPVKATTLVLWVGPALLMLIGILVLRRHLRSRAVASIDPPPLSAEEHSRASRLLEEKNG